MEVGPMERAQRVMLLRLTEVISFSGALILIHILALPSPRARCWRARPDGAS
ncbi:MAG: hypothetical protein R3D59_18890 [Paracoccaceae bacterium]